MVLAFWTPQQVKCPEALDLVEMRLTRHPQILEGFAFLLDDLETVHGDEHFDVSKVRLFSARFQLYRFLIGMAAILDNVSWSFSPKLQAL